MKNNTTLVRKNVAEAKAMLMPKVAPQVLDLRELYGIGSRNMNEADFRMICEKENIRLADGPEFKWMGEFEQVLGCLMLLPNDQFFIYLQSFWDGVDFDLQTAFHELGHYILGHDPTKPSDMLFKKMPITLAIKELEADLFSELCRRK